MGTKLSVRRQRFVDELLIDLNGAAAARRAGYKPNSARVTASQLLQEPEVQAAIALAKAERAERLKISQDDVLRPLWDAYTANPNDIMQFRRHCCRHCYGAGYRYQRTAGEMERDRERYDAAAKVAVGKQKAAIKPFDDKGGIGYDKRLTPATDCPECFGEGHGEMWIADTRNLTSEQLAQYAGIEQSKDGLKAKTMDKLAVAALLMRHMGMLQDKIDHTSGGRRLPSAHPGILMVPAVMTAEEWEAMAAGEGEEG